MEIYFVYHRIFRDFHWKHRWTEIGYSLCHVIIRLKTWNRNIVKGKVFNVIINFHVAVYNCDYFIECKRRVKNREWNLVKQQSWMTGNSLICWKHRFHTIITNLCRWTRFPFNNLNYNVIMKSQGVLTHQLWYTQRAYATIGFHTRYAEWYIMK